jgi:Cu(I)/Ag(I) efflux system membrane protein CusA/SilA
MQAAFIPVSLKIPGLSNSWTMPIRGRIEMLTTGLRTPIGLWSTQPAAVLSILLSIFAAEQRKVSGWELFGT